MRTIFRILLVGLLTACGSSVSNGEADSPADEGSVKEEVAAQDPKKPRIPRRCAKGKKHRGECVPPPGWVKRLCDDVYPDVALHMFSPGTPWKRLYMLARAEPFNASGGASLLGDKLERGEEVIALKRRSGDEGQIQVGEINAGYDGPAPRFTMATTRRIAPAASSSPRSSGGDSACHCGSSWRRSPRSPPPTKRVASRARASTSGKSPVIAKRTTSC
jgi:hypothetical protein